MGPSEQAPPELWMRWPRLSSEGYQNVERRGHGEADVLGDLLEGTLRAIVIGSAEALWGEKACLIVLEAPKLRRYLKVTC